MLPILERADIHLPAPCIVDSEIIRDADRFKMDLVGGLERTLRGQVKPSTRLPLPEEEERETD